MKTSLCNFCRRPFNHSVPKQNYCTDPCKQAGKAAAKRLKIKITVDQSNT